MTSIEKARRLKYIDHAMKITFCIAAISALAITLIACNISEFVRIRSDALFFGLIVGTWGTTFLSLFGSMCTTQALRSIKNSNPAPLPSTSSSTPSPSPPSSSIKLRSEDHEFYTLLSRSGSNTSLCQTSIFQVPGLLGEKLRDSRNQLTSVFSGKGFERPDKWASEKRGIATLLGGAVGDALFSHIEFMPYGPHYGKYRQIAMTSKEILGFTDKKNAFALEPGQWTDDTSMMLCYADALLLDRGQLVGTSLMKLFCAWWFRGYNNAFRLKPRGSVGLGGNINEALQAFTFQTHLKRGEYRAPVPADGNPLTSGNGSLMRNAPSVLGARSVEHAMSLAEMQSYTTHPGREAAECCQVMAYIMYHFIYRPSDYIDNFQSTQELKRKILDELPHYFAQKTFLESVQGLISSTKRVKNHDFPEQWEDWHWKSEHFSYNSKRVEKNPGYIGAYAMDALAMALHCVYTTHSFEEAVIKAGQRGGDADSVASITAQIAGALYGIDEIPRDWIAAVHQYDGQGEIAARALVLMRREFLEDRE